VENVDTESLALRESTAPTVTPAPSAAPQPVTAPVTAATDPCDLSLSAPSIEYVESAAQSWFTWRWDGLEQVRGLNWYLDIQIYQGEAQKSEYERELARVIVVEPAQIQVDGSVLVASGITREDGHGWVRGVSCPNYMRIQIGLRDDNGRFTCFISPPSEPVQVTEANWYCR
jgi:hypothetical protein